MPFVQAQEFAAAGKVVIHNIEYLAVSSVLNPGKNYRTGAVIDIRQRYRVGATQVKKNPERPDSNAAGNSLISGPVDLTWSDDCVRDAASGRILEHNLLLFHFGEAISFPS